MPEIQDVFLACCETNLGNPSISDDILTLGTGFLCAGARSVVSTLWTVDAFATTLFCEFYYYERQRHHDRPTALQNAQQQLRDLTTQDYLDWLDHHLESLTQIGEKLSAELENLKKSTRKSPNPDLSARYTTVQNQKQRIDRGKKQIETERMRTSEFQSDHPFASPYYWSGFVSQGLR
jgi:CHAT domain-containing protein